MKNIRDARARYADRIEDRREQSKQAYQWQKRLAGLEARIAAAKSGDSSRYTANQLSQISSDIWNRFLASMNKAQWDLINFEQWLDAKLNEIGDN